MLAFPQHGWRSRGPVALVAVIGLALTAAATWQTWQTQERNQLNALGSRAAALAVNLREGVGSDFQILDDLAIAERSVPVPGLDKTQFNAYADQTLGLHPEVLGLSWVPRVSDAQREPFERQLRLDGLPSFSIAERDARGNFVPAAQRDEYFPVAYSGSTSGSNGPWVGYDLASSPDRLRALVKADQTDRVAATSPITLFGSSGVERGFLAFRAVRQRQADDVGGQSALLGYVQATFAIDKLIDAIVSSQDTSGLHLQISDVISAEGNGSELPVFESASPVQGGVVRRSQLDIGGRIWQLSISATDESALRPQIVMPLLVLVAGLLVTVLAIALLALGLSRAQLRNAREQAQIAEAKRKSEEQFRALIENTADVFALVDLAGIVRYVSPSVERVLGYTPREVLGRYLLPFVHPHDRAVMQESFQAAGSSESHVDTRELQFRNASGSWQITELTTHSLLHNPAVEGIVITARDITQRKEAENALRQLAHYDPLTGLPNRTLLKDRLRAALESAHRGHHAFALAVLDLDRFKEVNDTLGHQAGDALLCEVAQRLQSEASERQTVARLGGDEFALLIPSVKDGEGAQQVVERFVRVLEGSFVIEGTTIGIGASAGVALYGAHGEDATTLLRCADVAMYAAKRDHLRLALYEPIHETSSTDELGMYAELRTAITTGELVLNYQPKIALQTAQPDAVEALVRWEHPRRGLIPPDTFIPLAERTGLMPSLTRWVAEAALEQMRSWHQQGMRLSVCINLSASALNDLELPEEIVRLVRVHGVSARHVVVEVTESAIMRDFERARRALDCLRAAGIRISVDDFGTGQSSLAYLKALPLDELKIDRTFVKEMLLDPQDEAIVRSVIELGHRLGLEVTAEGVEEAATFEALRQFGCDLAQGYWMGRPLAEQQLRDWFAEWEARRVHIAPATGSNGLERAA